MLKFWHLLYAGLMLFAACNTEKEKEENIDHLILAINDLDKGIAQFKELTGVEPLFGGIHPNSFTHNALVALDNDTYIEIMAPRPDAENVPEYITLLDNLTPVGWAVRSRAIDRTKEKVTAAGFATTEKREGSRAKPDGTVLSWTTFGVENNENFPFFIEWGATSIHPSTTSPKGCRLHSVTIVTSDVEPINKLEAQLQLGVTAVKGSEKQLKFVIETPNGQVSFPQTPK